MRNKLVFLLMLSGSVAPAMAQVGIGIGTPNMSIAINLPVYPELVPVPGYPVYYAPRLDSNYFFYDGMYWVYQEDNWYASSWYNGPWGLVDPEFVPLFVLRVPVRYYRQPPIYFRGWRSDESPRWGEHWGNNWAQHRSGWDHWDHNAMPAPPPLPVYQRQYSGNRYPRPEQQQTLQNRNYRYQPHDPVVRQQLQQREQSAPAAPRTEQRGAPQERNFAPRDAPRPNFQAPAPQGAPTMPRAPQRDNRDARQPAPTPELPQQRSQAGQNQRQPPQPTVAERRQPEPGSRAQESAQQGRDSPRETGRRQDQGGERERGQSDDHGQDQRR